MGIFEVISAVLLILACIFLIVTVLMQDSKKGIGGVLTGGSTDNYFQKNAERTKEGRLKRLTKLAAILIFVLILFANVAEAYTPDGENWLGNLFNKGSSDPSVTATTPEVTTAATDEPTSTSAEPSDTTGEQTTASDTTASDTTAA
ncbi:MAG: preprotein translocase subunit SecG [Oscillospiraceae bacterium]|jgi:preprotein translocase subunit SecG|nr:preprotein translocase subunit SecG [Oscillospiraceae bacterium]